MSRPGAPSATSGGTLSQRAETTNLMLLMALDELMDADDDENHRVVDDETTMNRTDPIMSAPDAFHLYLAAEEAALRVERTEKNKKASAASWSEFLRGERLRRGCAAGDLLNEFRYFTPPSLSTTGPGEGDDCCWWEAPFIAPGGNAQHAGNAADDDDVAQPGRPPQTVSELFQGLTTAYDQRHRVKEAGTKQWSPSRRRPAVQRATAQCVEHQLSPRGLSCAFTIPL